MRAITAADEGRHEAGPEALWGESWYLDFAAPDAAYGGYVRLGLYPRLGVTWIWVYLTGAGRPLVAVRDHALTCPEGDAALTPSSDALRVSYTTPTPFGHARFDAAATGVRLPDPADALHGEHGEPVPVRVALDWASVGPAFAYPMTTRYEQSARVSGEVTIGDETITIDAAGQRDHSWGVRDWWLFPWNWTSGAFGDGTRFHAARSIIPGVELFATGYVLDAGGAQHEVGAGDVSVDVDTDGDGLPTGARQRIGALRFLAEPVAHAPVLLVAPDGRATRFARALCRFTNDDGRTGTGWTEYNWPPGWPQA